MYYQVKKVDQDRFNELVDQAAASDKLLLQEDDVALIIDNDQATSATIYAVIK